jgi:hypothetical protein
VNEVEPQPLPTSVDGLIDLAAGAYVERAPLYLGLAAVVFVACAIVQFSWHASGAERITREIVVALVDLFVSALVVSTVATGIGTRVAGNARSSRALVAGALERWLPVLGAMVIVQFLVQLTAPGGGIGPIDDPALTILTAPFIWLFWGAMSLAGPVAALSGDRPTVAIVTGFGRALMLALRTVNLARLCLVALAAVAPLLLENVLADVLEHRGVGDPDFWANVPLDALTVGPLAALETVFALDFARRTGRQERRG